MHDLSIFEDDDDPRTFSVRGKIGGGEMMRLTIEPVAAMVGEDTLYVVRAACELPGTDLAIKQGNFIGPTQPDSPLRLLHQGLGAILEEQL